MTATYQQLCRPLSWAADRAWEWLVKRLMPTDLNDVDDDDDD